VFTDNVTSQSTNPDFVLQDTDGETWAIEADEPVPRSFAIAHNAGGVHSLIIEDGAPESSLYIDDSGRIGLGTASPFSALHLFALIPRITLETFSGGWSIEASGDDLCLGSCVPGATFIQLKSPALGGAIVISNAVQPSSRASKADIRAVDSSNVLARLLELPLAEWRYRSEPEGIRHIGPMAEDFRDAFALGADGTTISLLDAAGVALAAIQGLRAEQESQVARITAELAELRSQLERVDRQAAAGCDFGAHAAGETGMQGEKR
jgi:hypothetical protein